MSRISGYRWGVGAVLVAFVLSAAPSAQARDFFTSFFNSSFDNPAASQQRPQPSMALPFASPGGDLFGSPAEPARPRVSYGGGGQAYCVRTCDGRYFPITAGDGQSRAASCNNFCPGQRNQSGLRQQHRPRRYRERQTLFRTAERVPLPQRDGGGLHLQRQGPDRPRAGQDRGRSDAAQGRHRRRRRRADGRRPRRRQTRCIVELVAGPGVGSFASISACPWWRRSNLVPVALILRSATCARLEGWHGSCCGHPSRRRFAAPQEVARMLRVPRWNLGFQLR